MKDKILNMASIIEDWNQLDDDDIKELFDLDVEHVFAVYDDWEDLTKMCLERGDCDAYIIPFVDIESLAEYLKKANSGDWVELRSGKIVGIVKR